MTQNKQNAKKIWLPLIFATVISANPLAIAGNLDMPPMVAQDAATNQASDLTFITQDLAKRFPSYATDRILLIDATAQKMLLVEKGQQVGEWVISTALKGLGSRKGSDQTPTGVLRIAEKIGAGAPWGAIFKARNNTGRIAKVLTGSDEDSSEDNVTTRILWLDGLEPGVNKGGDVDSHERFIYIHGTDEEGKLGKPASHGCIRMRNQDVMDLFDRVDENTLVVITQKREG